MNDNLIVVAGFEGQGGCGEVSECFSCDRSVVLSDSDCERADVVLCPACGHAGMMYRKKPVAM